jgi:hypothetical protein
VVTSGGVGLQCLPRVGRGGDLMTIFGGGATVTSARTKGGGAAMPWLGEDDNPSLAGLGFKVEWADGCWVGCIVKQADFNKFWEEEKKELGHNRKNQ